MNAWSEVMHHDLYVFPTFWHRVDPLEGLTLADALDLAKRVIADMGIILRRAEQPAPRLVLAR